MKKDPRARNDDNPFRDSWRPVDKAAEAAIDHPAEFGESRPPEMTVSERRPAPDAGKGKTPRRR